MQWINSITQWKAAGELPNQPTVASTPSPAASATPLATPHLNAHLNSPYYQFLEFQSNYNNEDNPRMEGQSSSLIHPPPPPPRPLRAYTPQSLQDSAFCEGEMLRNYIEIQLSSCKVLMMHQPHVSSNGDVGDKKANLLCAYLVLASLDWDNRNTPPTPYWCSPSYEFDSLFPYFVYTIALVRQEVLNTWGTDGPVVITQIDTWIKRKRKDHQSLVQQEDRESFLHRNLAQVFTVKRDYLPRFPLLDDAAAVLIDRLLDSCEYLPHFRYGDVIWRGVEKHVQDNDKSYVKSLLWAYLTFQKLKLENDQMGFTTRDPYLANFYISALTQFHMLVGKPPLVTLQRDIQALMMKIFGAWQRDLPLLSFTSRGDSRALVLSNTRTVGRILLKVQQFDVCSQLCDALHSLRTALQQRRVSDGQHNIVMTPFPALTRPTDNNINSSEDMIELANIAQRVLK